MKVAIYSPYLDTAGGGEKYMMTIAETLSGGSEVDVLIGTHLYSANISEIKAKIESLHNLSLNNIKFVKSPIGPGSSIVKRAVFLKKYDLFFYLTDGSIFLSTAKKNILHFQVPFTNSSSSWWNKKKLASWQQAIYNSKFTKEIVEQTWPIKGQVIYPPVSIDSFKTSSKKKQIISVGRFFGFDKAKKHELMIDSFKQLVTENNLRGWSLHLVGAATDGDQDYLDQLKEQIGDAAIKLYPNAPFKKLVELYGSSSIYWHTTGFGETDPTKFEHFGITTVEAMAAGCVPVVINLGGQKEIVEDGISGYLWDTVSDLKRLTLKLISSNTLMKNLSDKAIKRSQIFDKSEFIKKINAIAYEN